MEGNIIAMIITMSIAIPILTLLWVMFAKWLVNKLKEKIND